MAEIRLICSDQDDDFITVPENIAKMSKTIETLLEDLGNTDAPIPLHNVTSATMKNVIEYLEWRAENPLPTEEEEDPKSYTEPPALSDFEKNFVDIEKEVMCELILAANYLDIKPLLELTCRTVAESLKGKDPEEVRQILNIKNDFTPEEEKRITEEKQWIEEQLKNQDRSNN